MRQQVPLNARICSDSLQILPFAVQAGISATNWKAKIRNCRLKRHNRLLTRASEAETSDRPIQLTFKPEAKQ